MCSCAVSACLHRVKVKRGKNEARSVVSERMAEWLTSEDAKEWRAQREKLWASA